MKIVLSPSKTKTICGAPTVPSFHPNVTERILMTVRSLSVGELGKALKLNDDKATEFHHFYAHFDDTPMGAACESYDGIVFKKLDWTSLSDTARAFGEEHLVILSALYGVVEPYMGIRDYRLDLVDKIGIDMYDVWRELVRDYFEQQDWILNLASKEYAKIVDHPAIVTVEFWERRGDAYKQMSTSSKISRGLMARYCLEREITELQQLPLTINGFTRVTDVTDILVPTESMVVRYEKEG